MKILHYIFFFFVLYSTGQENIFDNFSEKNGLISNDTYKIIQDKKGYLWFATSSGVSKYDGITFKDYSTKHGLTDYDILSLYEDKKGRIWFYTFNGKPCFYYNDKIYNAENHSLLKQIHFTKLISNVFEDYRGYVWICTSKESYAIDFENKKVYHHPGIAGVMSIQKSNDTHILNGVDEYYSVAQNNTYKTINYVKDTTFSRIGNGTVLNNCSIIYFTRNNANNYFYYSKASKYKFVKYSIGETILSISTHKEYVFYCTRNGVYQYHQDDFDRPIRHMLPGKTVTSFLVDHQGNYWFSTKNGIYMTNNNFYYVDKSLNYLTNFAVSENYILSGNVDGFLCLFDKNTHKKIKKYKISKSPKNIIAYKDAFYVSSNNKSYVVDYLGVTEVFKNFTSKAFVIKNDSIFMALSKGLFSVQIDKNNIGDDTTFKKLCEKPSFLFLNKERSYTLNLIKDTLFGSSKSYLTRYYHKEIDTLKFANEATKNRVSAIEYHNNFLYLVTNSKGLYIYKNNLLKYHYDENKGLLSNQINNIFFHSGNCYIVTKKGIQYITDRGLVNLDATISNNFVINKAAIVNKTLLMTTSNGFIKSDLDNFQIKNKTVRSEIIAKSKNEIISPSSILSYKNNEVVFDFKIFNYTSKQLNYSFLLKGVDDHWNKIKGNSVQYKNIPPGNYTFQLKNNENIINEFSLQIEKPFWKKWWFYIVSILLLVMFIVLLYKVLLDRRLKKASKNYEINLMIAKAEQDALKAQMNPHFIFNALNAIQNLILQNSSRNAYQYLGDFSKLVRNILNNSRNLTVTIASEIRFLNLYLKLEELRFKNKFDYQIKIDATMNQELHIPSMVIQPFVENAILHGLLPLENKNNALLLINFTEDDLFIYCTIDDNGIGRERSRLLRRYDKESLGMQITLDRISFYDQEGLSHFKVMDKEEGTQVLLKIKKHVKRNYS
ncbi:histidine kinase [Aquimarina sp. 2201CG1-2-11]|uniref:sensor histidine kinase n=1 Tax=Aquimarina discodermiae TaxID=3231043 RepID=UPI00346228E1